MSSKPLDNKKQRRATLAILMAMILAFALVATVLVIGINNRNLKNGTNENGPGQGGVTELKAPTVRSQNGYNIKDLVVGDALDITVTARSATGAEIEDGFDFQWQTIVAHPAKDKDGNTINSPEPILKGNTDAFNEKDKDNNGYVTDPEQAKEGMGLIDVTDFDKDGDKSTATIPVEFLGEKSDISKFDVDENGNLLTGTYVGDDESESGVTRDDDTYTDSDIAGTVGILYIIPQAQGHLGDTVSPWGKTVITVYVDGNSIEVGGPEGTLTSKRSAKWWLGHKEGDGSYTNGDNYKKSQFGTTIDADGYYWDINNKNIYNINGIHTSRNGLGQLRYHDANGNYLGADNQYYTSSNVEITDDAIKSNLDSIKSELEVFFATDSTKKEVGDPVLSYTPEDNNSDTGSITTIIDPSNANPTQKPTSYDTKFRNLKYGSGKSGYATSMTMSFGALNLYNKGSSYNGTVVMDLTLGSIENNGWSQDLILIFSVVSGKDVLLAGHGARDLNNDLSNIEETTYEQFDLGKNGESILNEDSFDLTVNIIDTENVEVSIGTLDFKTINYSDSVLQNTDGFSDRKIDFFDSLIVWGNVDPISTSNGPMSFQTNTAITVKELTFRKPIKF